MVILVYWQILEATELDVAKVVEFLGGEVKFINLAKADDEKEGQVLMKGCVIVRAGVLAEMEKRLGGDSLYKLTGSNCFVYGFETGHDRLLRKLTSGRLLTVESPAAGETHFNVESGTQEICQHFTGLSFGTVSPDFDHVFVEGENLTGDPPLIRIGKRPFFVSFKNQSSEFFLLGCRQIADLDEIVSRATSVETFFSRLVPLVMFLRQVGGARYWHNDSPRACLILDDPLLKEQYGFLNYETLLRLMERERFTTSIAFIPWNYRRSNQRIAELFRRFPHRYSLCVHGCDHTHKEFGSINFEQLKERAEKGRQRMGRHRELTGIGFDDVMVFPQGYFSTVAMKALKLCGYLAAVNTTCYPVDLDGDTLRLRDLVGVAVTKFSGFPLFVRRYPNDLIGLAFDLFFNKSALLVEHHGYFRNGYGPLAEVIRKLNGMEGRLEWSPLSTVCSHACLKRRTKNGDVQVRFYTDRFCLRNDTSVAQRYDLFQRLQTEEPLPGVSIDGVPVRGDHVMDDLKVTCELNAGRTAQVQIQRAKFEVAPVFSRLRPMQQAGVFLRRHLSEFRDNRVDKIPFLSRMTSRVRNRLVMKK